MAIQRYKIDGYGQLELNNVSFPRDGRVEAQCRLTKTFTDKAPCEVGMLLAIDRVKREVRLPQEGEKLPVALNYSSEKIYDTNKSLKDFYQYAGGNYDTPRMGYLAVGELFTSNCICYDTTEFTNDEAVKTAMSTLGTTPVYATYSTLGAIKLTKKEVTAEKIVLQVVEGTTMPDGQFGIKFQVVKA